MLPITDQLKKYAVQNISLHVPGHHNHTIGNLDLKLSYDMTEISGLDDYHHPEDIISRSEQLLVRNEQYISRYLVNGTTSGILSVIQAADHVAVMRNAHQSIFNTLALKDKQAWILPTTVSSLTGQYIAVDMTQISSELLRHTTLAVLTYPNYFGETYDLNEVIDFFHRHNIEVLVDEAHGAHFDITGHFPKSAVNFNADYIVQSYHKTLPALTMGSVIHIKKSAKLIADVLNYLTVFQTSSPSYLVLASLEQAHAFYLNYNDELFIERRKQLIQVLIQHFEVMEPADPLKVLISCPGWSGVELQAMLEKHHIFTELATISHVLLVLPLWHEGDHFPFERLLYELQCLTINRRPGQSKDFTLPIHEGVYQQPSGRTTEIRLQQAEGKIAAESLIPYPPGIPYVLAGERITIQHIDFLIHQTNVHGMINGYIKIIEEG